MTAVGFASEEALLAALTAELLSAEEVLTPIRFWRDADALWVRPRRAPAAATLARLRDGGARAVRTTAPGHAQRGNSWLEAVAPRFVGEPSEPIETVLFESSETDSLLELAAEMLRLGCDRQRYQLCQPPRLLVAAPPFFTLMRALDARSGLRAFVPAGRSGVWVELGYEHPLAERVTVDAASIVLISQRGWETLPAGTWQEIDGLLDLALPGAAHPFVSRPLERRLTITPRLLRTGLPRPPQLWVLRERAVEEVERLLQDLPAEVAEHLSFAVGRVDGEELLALRAREGAPPLELALRAERYAPHPQLVSLMLPCDTTLEPPLGRARLARLFDASGGRLSWLRSDRGGAFTVEHAELDAFRPLGDFVDYVVAMSEAAIVPWIEASVFELDHLERADLGPLERRPRERAARSEAPESSEPAPAAVVADKPTTGRRKRGKALPAPPALPERVEASEAAQRVTELEQRFLALEGPADAEERLHAWLLLGEAYEAAGRRDDAAHALVRVLWERGEDPALAGRWLAVEGAGDSAHALLAVSWPSPGQFRALVATLYASTEAVPLEALSRFVDSHEHGADVRTRWLAHLGVSKRAGGDALRLTRARDRALAELRAGLSLDRDVPSFLRARATGHGDLALAEVLSAELERLYSLVRATKRERSAIEADEAVTAAYARRLFAHGFARLGRRDQTLALLAEDDAADKRDPVHGVLLGILEMRVRHALEGLSPMAPLSGELTARLNHLGTFERYKVDRLREASRILEPVERLDAVRGFQRGEADPRGDEFAGLRALDPGPELSARVAAIVERACDDATTPAERARLLDGAMDFFFALPVSRATALLEQLVGSLEPVERFYRALLVEEALVLAAHFGHDALIVQLTERLSGLIAELGPERARELGSVLEGALSTLRRVGLRDRAAALLDAVAAISDGDAPELLLARVHVAGGLIHLGASARAEPILAEARGVLDTPMPIKDRLELTRAMAGAAALFPAEARVAEMRALARQLTQISDSFSTNSHFCLSLLHFLESLITGLVPPDRGRDGPAAAYLDEDEHLVRRRIHRDLRETLS